MTISNRTKNIIALIVEIIGFAVTIYTAYTLVTNTPEMFITKIIIILVSLSIATITFCKQFDFSMDLAFALISLIFSLITLAIQIFA